VVYPLGGGLRAPLGALTGMLGERRRPPLRRLEVRSYKAAFVSRREPGIRWRLKRLEDLARGADQRHDPETGQARAHMIEFLNRIARARLAGDLTAEELRAKVDAIRAARKAKAEKMRGGKSA
jgi:hypothetical protein